jgi:hypothetical protein
VGKPFRDCLLLNVGVEHGDHAMPEKAITIVRSIADAIHAGQIVVNGSILLPEIGEKRCAPGRFDVLSELADALDVLTEFAERLEEHGEPVHLMPFGWKSHCHIDAPGHHGAPWVIHLSPSPVDAGVAGTGRATIRAYTRPRRPPYWSRTCTTSS